MTVVGVTVGILIGMAIKHGVGQDHKMSLIDFAGFMGLYALLSWVLDL